MLDAHAAVVAQQVSDLRVDAAFERGRGARVPVLKEREHMAGFGGAVQDAPCLAKAVVGEAEVAVVVEGALFREVSELLPPCFEHQPPGDRGIDVADEAILFTFQTLTVLLGWLSGELTVFEDGIFGPSPTGLPLVLDEGELWSYGLVNLVIMTVGVALIVLIVSLRDRRRAKKSAAAGQR